MKRKKPDRPTLDTTALHTTLPPSAPRSKEIKGRSAGLSVSTNTPPQNINFFHSFEKEALTRLSSFLPQQQQLGLHWLVIGCSGRGAVVKACIPKGSQRKWQKTGKWNWGHSTQPYVQLYICKECINITAVALRDSWRRRQAQLSGPTWMWEVGCMRQILKQCGGRVHRIFCWISNWAFWKTEVIYFQWEQVRA